MIRDKLAFAQDAFTFFKTSAVKSNQSTYVKLICLQGRQVFYGRLLSSFVHVLFYWTLWLNIYEKDWKGTWQVIAVFVQAISCLPLAAFPSSDWGLGWFFVEPASYSVAVWCKVLSVPECRSTTLYNDTMESSNPHCFAASTFCNLHPWDHDPHWVA